MIVCSVVAIECQLPSSLLSHIYPWFNSSCVSDHTVTAAKESGSASGQSNTKYEPHYSISNDIAPPMWTLRDSPTVPRRTPDLPNCAGVDVVSSRRHPDSSLVVLASTQWIPCSLLGSYRYYHRHPGSPNCGIVNYE